MTNLDAHRIRKSLQKRSASCLDQVEVFSHIDSTNTYLKDQPAPAPGRFRVVVADHQTAGRGRHDKEWISAPGESLCLSMSFRFASTPPDLPALTLALGTGIAAALAAAGVADVRLKWPNDLLVGNGKLGGILTETVFRGHDDVIVIVGIGINVVLGAAREQITRSEWAESATSLADAMANPLTRDALAELVIESVMATFQQFEAEGFAPFHAQYGDFDWLLGKSLVVDAPEGFVKGVGAGVAADGALLVQTTDGKQKVYTGSIRQVEAPT